MPDWEDAARVFGDVVREYHAKRGRAPDDPSVQSTIRTNSELVPRRGDNLLAILEAWTDRGSLSGSRLLEVGSGFGALAAYLALRTGADRVVGVDVRRDFVETAADCARRLEIEDRVQYVQSDMRALHRIGESGVDVLIANNAFIYLPTAKEMDAALREFHKLLSPGGWVLLFHANRWTWREPFTKAPILHLVPSPVARAISRVTGWKHSHGRVRLIAPWELRWRLRRAGFEDIRFGGFDQRGLTPGGHFRSYYAMVARKPVPR